LLQCVNCCFENNVRRDKEINRWKHLSTSLMFIYQTGVFREPLPSRPHEPWAQQSWSGVCRSRWCVFG